MYVCMYVCIHVYILLLIYIYYRYFVRKEHCEPKFLTEYWVELNALYVCVCVYISILLIYIYIYVIQVLCAQGTLRAEVSDRILG
jgi:hypothetical protein